jgi:hypothetical protein
MKVRVGGPPPGSVSRAPYQLQDASLGSTVLAMVVHFLQDKPHVILPLSGKAVCDSLLQRRQVLVWHEA